MRSPYPIGLATSLLLCSGMWLYVSRVIVPQQKAYAAIHGNPRGNLSDLYPRWLGSRELLLHRRDPYSAEITREIQVGYYGRALDPARPNDPGDQEAFAYPVYVVFLLAPSIGLPFPAVQVIFRWTLAALTGISVLLWLRVVDWKPSGITALTLLALTLATFWVVQGIRLQQLTLLVAPMIAASVYFLIKNRQVPSGILLGLATVKPQIAMPLAAWLIMWACSRIHLRWKIRHRVCGDTADPWGRRRAVAPGMDIGVLRGGGRVPWLHSAPFPARRASHSGARNSAVARHRCNRGRTVLAGAKQSRYRRFSYLDNVAGVGGQPVGHSHHCALQPATSVAGSFSPAAGLEQDRPGNPYDPRSGLGRRRMPGLALDHRGYTGLVVVFHSGGAAILGGSALDEHCDTHSDHCVPGAAHPPASKQTSRLISRH